MPTPFVNRHDELEFLGLALKRTRTGQGQVVAVVGEPGVGKSRLLNELTRRSADQGWRIRGTSACSATGSGRPSTRLWRRYASPRRARRRPG
jgi:predicted ATPase